MKNQKRVPEAIIVNSNPVDAICETDEKHQIAPVGSNYGNLAPFEQYDTLAIYSKKLNMAKEVLDKNGLVNTTDGYIGPLGQPEFASMISAVPFMEGGPVGALICNTINNGFRFCGINEDGYTDDLGPVNVPCIIGNTNKPQAILIPLEDKALEVGLEILQNLVEVNKSKVIENFDDVSNVDRIPSRKSGWII